jgi:hypothetical protein
MSRWRPAIRRDSPGTDGQRAGGADTVELGIYRANGDPSSLGGILGTGTGSTSSSMSL